MTPSCYDLCVKSKSVHHFGFNDNVKFAMAFTKAVHFECLLLLLHCTVM